MTKIYNREKLKDQNKSNFSYGTKPILIKQLRDKKIIQATIKLKYLMGLEITKSNKSTLYYYMKTMLLSPFNLTIQISLFILDGSGIDGTQILNYLAC